MHKIADKLMEVKRRIQQAARLSGRNPNGITLLAVSKKHSLASIEEASKAGQRDFGENYLQEALNKINQLPANNICWHFIGPIQGNKAKKIAQHFHWAHSVDNIKVAQKLSKFRVNLPAEMNVCLQINIDQENTKAGVLPEEAAELAGQICRLPGLKLRGLMAIPASGTNFNHEDNAHENNAFARLRQLFDKLKLHDKHLAGMDTLSMGMSADLEAAIREGSTIVRVGTDIFGPREINTEIG